MPLTIPRALAALALMAAPAAAQVTEDATVGPGWASRDLVFTGVEGAARIVWSVETGVAGLPVVCGAWSAPDEALARAALAAIAGGYAQEDGRVVLPSLVHFAQGTGDLLGADAPCVPSTGLAAEDIEVILGVVTLEDLLPPDVDEDDLD